MFQIVQILLERGCDTNSRLNDGASSLFLAAQAGNLRIVSLLISKGAEVDAKRNVS